MWPVTTHTAAGPPLVSQIRQFTRLTELEDSNGEILDQWGTFLIQRRCDRKKRLFRSGGWFTTFLCKGFSKTISLIILVCTNELVVSMERKHFLFVLHGNWWHSQKVSFWTSTCYSISVWPKSNNYYLLFGSYRVKSCVFCMLGLGWYLIITI